MSEDRNIARQLVEKEEARLRALIQQHEGSTVWEGAGPLPHEGDRTDVLVNSATGHRDDLAKTAACKNAAIWQRLVAQYPCGTFNLHLLGYDDDDPREVWQIVDAICGCGPARRRISP